MAATGYTPIYLYYSNTATNQPSAGNLGYGELALNITDKNLFFKDNTNTVNTVPIRQSSASSNGWLSSTDWSTFNSKQPAGTYVTSVTGTAPVVSSGGTTPAISMAAATGSVNGYLTSTDWTTFNSKQAALGYTPVNKAGDTMTGSLTSPSFIPSSSTAPTNGLYLPTTNTFGLAANSTALVSGTSTVFSVLAGKTLRLNRSDNATYNEISYAASDKFLFNQANGGTYNFAVAGTEVAGISAAGQLSAVSLSVSSSSSGAPVIQANNTDSGFASTLNYLTTSRAATASFDFIGAYANSVAQFRVDGAGNTITTGNFVVATSGKGIDFSATAGTGTSELLADYEEGTWTPTITAGTGSITSYSVSAAYYTKIGRSVTLNLLFSITNNGTGASYIQITGVPYTTAFSTCGTIYNQSTGLTGSTTLTSTTMYLTTYSGAYPVATGQTVQMSITYSV